jgi:prepilin-type processing-associated H-X9-DG protein
MNLKRIQTRRVASNRIQQPHAFTLIELVVVLLMVALLGLTLVPGAAKLRPNTQVIQCQNNLRQLTEAWTMYSADYSGRVANNYGVDEMTASITSGLFDNWVNNVMTWGASGTTADRSNTNNAWVVNGGLGRYTAAAIGVYRCPADNYLSLPQRAAGFPYRNRSLSMNSTFGRFSSGSDPTAQGINWAFSQYRQYLKYTQVPKPAKTWLIIEEHPDSINDGYFINNPDLNYWQDIPSSFHNGGCSLSFTDGHTELKRWQSPTSWYRGVQFSYPVTRAFDTLGRADYAWFLSRTGWVSASSGQGMFGY